LSEKPKVLICHPNRQYSHQTALALQKGGLLAGYWAGLPCLEMQARNLPKFVSARLVGYSPVTLPKDLVRCFPVAPVLRKTGNFILPSSVLRKNWEYAGYRLFDKWVAHELPKYKIDAVIAYENSALEAFKAARRLGITAILDAASIHHQAQDRVCSYAESEVLHRQINRKKDEEIRLADYISTVSNLAYQTYLDAGVSAEKLHIVMLGADLNLFTPKLDIFRDVKDGFTFLFVGAIILRKGIDLLLEAFDRVSSSCSDICLRIVGGSGDAAHLINRYRSNNTQLVGPRTQKQLVTEYQKADCLILPSRHDSFGMVVAESLACGTPVIVSDMVGAKDIIKDGENGWIVPAGDVDALAKRMSWCVQHRDALGKMREKARLSAEQFSWSAYHKRLIDWTLAIFGAKIASE
jgi:glycosyltransferase involved in cell wall biosynthesis